MAWVSDPTRTVALDHMTRALEAAKRARDRGLDVHEARRLLKESRSAFERGDYATAMDRADHILRMLEPGSELSTAPAIRSAAPIAPTPTDLGAAAGRLAEATEAMRQAKAHGFDVHAAKAALKLAKRAFKSRDYARTLELAGQAIDLSGVAGRVRP